jgi:hypothetical protein
MKYLLALGILAVSVVLSGCGRSYNSNSTAYHNRSYSTYTSSSYRRHRERGSRRGGNGGSHRHHHHDGDRDHGKGHR